MTLKLEKAVVLYFTAEEIGSPEGARCGKCMMFVSGGFCTIVQGKIDGTHGVCGLYVNGPMEHEEEAADMAMTPKLVAGYIENGPTHCGNCEYYGGWEKKQGPCEKVRGTVEYHGCCNAWEGEP